MDPALVMKRLFADASITLVGVVMVILPAPRVAKSLCRFTSKLLVNAIFPVLASIGPVMFSAPVVVRAVALVEVIELA